MTKSDGFENFDDAEHALSSKMPEKSKDKEKNKIPPATILAGASLVLIIVLAIQFLFSGSDEITETTIPPEALQQFEGQLEVYSGMIDNYRILNGILPENEEDFIGRDDPVVTYTVTGADSYRLEYNFLDSTIVVNKALEPVSAPVRTPPAGIDEPAGLPAEAPVPPG